MRDKGTSDRGGASQQTRNSRGTSLLLHPEDVRSLSATICLGEIDRPRPTVLDACIPGVDLYLRHHKLSTRPPRFGQRVSEVCKYCEVEIGIVTGNQISQVNRVQDAFHFAH